MTELIKGSIYITFSNYLSFFINFIASIFIVRLLPVSEYGLVGYFTSIYTVLFPLYNLNLNSAITHFIPKYSDNKWIVFKKSFKIFLIWSPIITFSSAFLFFFFQNIIFLILIIIFLINSLITFILGYFRGIMNFKNYSIILILNNLITVFAFIFVLISSVALFYYLGYLLALILILISSVYLLQRNKLNHQKTPADQPLEKSISKKELLLYSIPLFLLSLISFFRSQYDRLLIYHVEGDVIAGNYYFLLLYAGILGFLFLSINDALFPIISEKFYAKNYEEINDYYQNILKFSILIYFFIMTYLIILGGPIISLVFGTKYLSHINILGILFFSSIFSVFGYCTATMYLSHNIVKKMAVYLIIATIISIGLKTILILAFGIWGASISLVIVEFITQVLLIKILLRNTELKFPSITIFKIGFIGILNFLIFYGIIIIFELNLILIGCAIGASLIFFVLLIRFSRIFHKKDFELISSILINLKLGEKLTHKVVNLLQFIFLPKSSNDQSKYSA